MGEELISVRDELNTEANLFAGLTDEDRENLENTLLQDELSGLKDEDFLDEGEVVPIFNKPFSQGDDLDDRFHGLGKDVIQDPKNRQPLPPETRAAILMRDGAKCQACGFGEGYKDNIHLGLLECHHITAVYLGGADTASNFVTLCNTTRRFSYAPKLKPVSASASTSLPATRSGWLRQSQNAT